MIFVFFHHFHSFSINILSLHEFTMLKNQTTWSTTCHCRLWGTTKAATGPQKESPAPGSESPTAGKFRNVRRLGEQTCLTMALIAVKNWTLHYNIILYIYTHFLYLLNLLFWSILKSIWSRQSKWWGFITFSTLQSPGLIPSWLRALCV